LFIDSHAHLAECTADQLNDILKRAEDLSISTILNVATDIASTKVIIDQCQAPRSITMYGSAGVSTPEIGNVNSSWEADLVKLLESPQIIAVGEIGIDGINSSYPSLQLQRPFFRRQLELARDFNCTALIHGRGAEREALETCLELGVKKALFHCFTGNLEDAQSIVEAGYCLSFSGIITFKKSGFDEIVRSIPTDQILFETDSPYLAPVPVRGTVNEPANVSYVYRYAADLRGVTSEQLATQCQKTFLKLFSPRI